MKKTSHQIRTATGIALALAAAGLINNVHAENSSLHANEVELSHCYGVNKCRGQNDCGSEANFCGGHGECKGRGFINTTTKSCAALGGEVKDDWRGSVKTSKLIHCHGVNKCAGHNDCSTTDNSCAGQASCKGTGFVALEKRACELVDGTVEAKLIDN